MSDDATRNEKADVEPEPNALLVEYEKAQDSAQFHDGLVWTSTGITWALGIGLLGFALSHLDLKWPVTIAAVFGVLFIVFQMQTQSLFRSVKNQNTLDYPKNAQTLFYRAISVAFIAAWISIVSIAWATCSK